MRSLRKVPVVVLAAFVAGLTAAAGAHAAPGVWRASHGSALLPPAAALGEFVARGSAPRAATEAPSLADAGHAPVTSPQISVLDPSTGTLYVTSDPNTLFVVDARRCNAKRHAGCAGAVVATVSDAGSGGAAVDGSTGTIYVGDPANSAISVIDGTTCNARITTGCGALAGHVAVGGIPIGLAVDPARHTLYAGNVEPFVSVVDTAACNRSTTSGCATTPATVPTLPGPVFPTVDAASSTVYVPENGDESDFGTTMAVIDETTCNATTITGCGQVTGRVTVGSAPVTALVDPATNTVYVENQGDLTISIIDGATCNGAVTTGCAATPPTLQVGADPNSGMVIDQGTRTMYVVNEGSDTLSAVDVRRCHAGDTSGCARRSPTIATGFKPFWITLDPGTKTLYVPENGENDVAVLPARTCTARKHTGCRREAPMAAIPHGTFSVAVDVAHHTLLVGGGGALALMDTRSCRAGHLAGCRTVTDEFPLGPELRDIAVDRAAHTAYVTDTQNAAVLVLDTSACHAGRPAGCAPVAAVPTGEVPIALALNPRTHTVYVANIAGGSLSVIAGAHCSAVHRSGCATTPLTVPVNPVPFGVAVDAGSNSVYVSDFDFGANRVQVLDGAACEAGGAGCVPLADIPVGDNPLGLDIDRGTHTLYVANQAFNDARGSVSVVDLRHCTAADTSGCGDPSPAISAGTGTWAVTIDAATHAVYTANFGNASVSLIQGATCNATSHTGCDRTPPRVPVGDIPLDVALDRSTHTLYTSDAPELAVSVIDTRRPCKAPSGCLR